MKLSKRQVDSFNANGFLILPGFFKKGELRMIEDTLRSVIATYVEKAAREHPGKIRPDKIKGKEFDDGVFALEAISHGYISEIYDAMSQTPAFLRFISQEKMAVCINQLLGQFLNNPLYSFTARCRIDQPHDTQFTYGWHQEVFYSIAESQFLQTWAPLIRDTTRKNGTIEVCARSHQEGIAKQRYEDRAGRPYYIVDEAVVRKYPDQLSLEMKLGDLLIFQSRLFHRSGVNSSKQVRYSLVGMYHNINHPTFHAPGIQYSHKGKSPKSYYDEFFRK